VNVVARFVIVFCLGGLLMEIPSMSSAADTDRGIVRIRSPHSVAVTADRLAAILKERDIIVFARIDFSGDAARAGLTMRPEQLLIFGNPKSGTPLMQGAPTAGLDLPLRALIWEDSDGKTWIAWNDPQYVVRRHGLPAALGANLAAVAPLLERAAHE
jgi:uncharacterized protein (DUF302 family)